MTTTHAEFLELAAAAIDFELSDAERAVAFRPPGRLRRLPTTAGRPRGRPAGDRPAARLRAGPGRRPADPVTTSVGGPRPAPSSDAPARGGRLLAVLTLTAITVGSELLRRSRDDDLSVVTPSVVAVPSPSSPAGPDRSATPGPSVFARGSILEVVVTGLRVRTAPTVDNTKSAKLQPLLGPGVKLEVLDGPVTADDYDWYQVQAVGLPHRGWVAAADHDGVAWIDDPASTAAPASAATADEAALIAGLRAEAAVALRPAPDRPSRAGDRRRRLSRGVGAGGARRGVPVSRCP